MDFSDHSFIAPGREGPIRVRVTGGALHVFWGADVGPQDADGLIAANREMIDDIIREKIAAGDVVNGEVTIQGVDIEG